MNEQKSVEGQKFYGKHRARVRDNLDPLGLGRLMPEVPSMPGMQLNWAIPCVPYAGSQVGFYALPPIGANIWIEYEGGDLNYPIWTGCFWGEGDLPTGALPDKKFFKTESATLQLNDEPGLTELSIECNLNEGRPLSVRLNSEGIILEASGAKIFMTSEGIKLTVPDSEIALTPEMITLSAHDASVALLQNFIAVSVSSSGFEINEDNINQYDKN